MVENQHILFSLKSRNSTYVGDKDEALSAPIFNTQNSLTFLTPSPLNGSSESWQLGNHLIFCIFIQISLRFTVKSEAFLATFFNSDQQSFILVLPDSSYLPNYQKVKFSYGSIQAPMLCKVKKISAHEFLNSKADFTNPTNGGEGA